MNNKIVISKIILVLLMLLSSITGALIHECDLYRNLKHDGNAHAFLHNIYSIEMKNNNIRNE